MGKWTSVVYDIVGNLEAAAVWSGTKNQTAHLTNIKVWLYVTEFRSLVLLLHSILNEPQITTHMVLLRLSYRHRRWCDFASYALSFASTGGKAGKIGGISLKETRDNYRWDEDREQFLGLSSGEICIAGREISVKLRDIEEAYTSCSQHTYFYFLKNTIVKIILAESSFDAFCCQSSWDSMIFIVILTFQFLFLIPKIHSFQFHLKSTTEKKNRNNLLTLYVITYQPSSEKQEAVKRIKGFIIISFGVFFIVTLKGFYYAPWTLKWKRSRWWRTERQNGDFSYILQLCCLSLTVHKGSFCK